MKNYIKKFFIVNICFIINITIIIFVGNLIFSYMNFVLCNQTASFLKYDNNNPLDIPPPGISCSLSSYRQFYIIVFIFLIISFILMFSLSYSLIKKFIKK